MGHWESFERFWESLGMPWVGLWGSLDALGTVLGRSEGIWGCLGVVLGASSGGLDVIWGAFGMCLGDFGISQRGKKGSQEQLKKNTLTFDKSCSRVGASMVFRGRSVPGGTKWCRNRPRGDPREAWSPKLCKELQQEAPRVPRERPRIPQERPKTDGKRPREALTRFGPAAVGLWRRPRPPRKEDVQSSEEDIVIEGKN